MAGNWTDVIGNYTNINGNYIRTEIGHVTYLNILKKIDLHLENSLNDNENFKGYENLYMALHPKKKTKSEKGDKKEKSEKSDSQYTYMGQKTTIVTKTNEKGEEVKEKVVEECELPVKKYPNITFHYRTGMAFIFQKYVHECVSCFNAEKNKFRDKDEVLTQVCKYSQSNISNPVAPAVVRAADMFKIDQIIDADYNEFSIHLFEKCKMYFKGKEDQVPQEQLRTIINAFVRFVKIISVYIADLIYEKRQTINDNILFGILRLINSNIYQYDAGFSESLFELMKSYIEIQRPKNESQNNSKEEVDENTDETTNSTAKKTKRAPKSTKTTKETKETKDSKATKGTKKNNKKVVVASNVPSKVPESEDIDIEADSNWKDIDVEQC